MGLCLVGHHLILSEGENPKLLGLKRPFALQCPRSPGLAPWSHRSYLLMDSLVSRYGARPLGLDLRADARRSEGVAAIARTSHRFGFAVGSDDPLT